MQLSKTLEILIALALVYFLFSTLVSVLFEWYAYKTQQRGRFLYETILKLLNDPVNQSYGANLYSQYSINQLKKDKDSYPQYISSSMFADALIDLIGTQSETLQFENVFDSQDSNNIMEVNMHENRFTDPYERFQKGVEQMNYSALKSQLRAFHEKTTNYLELKKMIMDWFDDYMARVSGWYKLKTKTALFYISLGIALAFNLDSIALVKKLNTDNTLRANLVVQAEQKVLKKELQEMAAAKATNGNTSTKQQEAIEDHAKKVEEQLKEINDAAIPIGYHGINDVIKTHGNYYRFFWLLGILTSAYALSFGAPFWFEVMVKAINVRRAGIKPS